MPVTSKSTAHPMFSFPFPDHELSYLDINAMIEGTADVTNIENSPYFINNIKMTKLLKNSIALIDERLAQKLQVGTQIV